MNFEEYLNYLLDIMVDYAKHMHRIHFFFSECIGGKVDPIINDLQRLIEKPIKEYNKIDWQSIGYILSLKKRK